MKHPKTYPIQIWHLDEDCNVSAQYLSNDLLYKTIKGCIQALVAARFYYIGIRNKKFYKFYFDKDHKESTMSRFFPMWPLARHPMFMQYDSKQSRWCRKCKEHYEYIKMYLEALTVEYEFRFGKPYSSALKFIEWLDCDAPDIKIPEGKLKKILFEWKCLDPRYRKSNIVEGYRAQCKAMLNNYGIEIKDFTNRDIPEFLLEDEIKKASDKWML